MRGCACALWWHTLVIWWHATSVVTSRCASVRSDASWRVLLFFIWSQKLWAVIWQLKVTKLAPSVMYLWAGEVPALAHNWNLCWNKCPLHSVSPDLPNPYEVRAEVYTTKHNKQQLQQLHHKHRTKQTRTTENTNKINTTSTNHNKLENWSWNTTKITPQATNKTSENGAHGQVYLWEIFWQYCCSAIPSNWLSCTSRWSRQQTAPSSHLFSHLVYSVSSYSQVIEIGAPAC